jgi:hypothetical protein
VFGRLLRALAPRYSIEELQIVASPGQRRIYRVCQVCTGIPCSLACIEYIYMCIYICNKTEKLAKYLTEVAPCGVRPFHFRGPRPHLVTRPIPATGLRPHDVTWKDPTRRGFRVGAGVGSNAAGSQVAAVSDQRSRTRAQARLRGHDVTTNHD